MTGRGDFLRLWAVPIALGFLSALGLLSALLGDDVWDAVSWIALAVPVAICLWFGLLRRTSTRT